MSTGCRQALPGRQTVKQQTADAEGRHEVKTAEITGNRTGKFPREQGFHNIGVHFGAAHVAPLPFPQAQGIGRRVDVLERRGFIGDDDDFVLQVPDLRVGFGPGPEKPAKGQARKGARGPHIADQGKHRQVDGAGVIGRPVFQGRVMLQALEFAGRVLSRGPDGQEFGEAEHDLAVFIAHGGGIAADHPIGVGEESHQSHVQGLPGQGGKVIRNGQGCLDFLLPVDPQVGRHDHLTGRQLLLERPVILQGWVVRGQVVLFQPVLDAHIIEIIQSHDFGAGPPENFDDPGKIRGPADQRVLGVLVQGRLIQGDDGHMLRRITAAGQLMPEVGVNTFRFFQPAGPGHALHDRAHQNQQGDQVQPRSFPTEIFHRLKGVCRFDMTPALIGSRRVSVPPTQKDFTKRLPNCQWLPSVFGNAALNLNLYRSLKSWTSRRAVRKPSPEARLAKGQSARTAALRE